jgi:hypothetical protein
MSEYTCTRCGKKCKSRFGLTNHQKSCTAPECPEDVRVARGEDSSIGAFHIAQEHVCVLLDLNFCAALGQFILDQDSENKAILAFGHRVAQIAEDYRES